MFHFEFCTIAKIEVYILVLDVEYLVLTIVRRCPFFVCGEFNPCFWIFGYEGFVLMEGE